MTTGSDSSSTSPYLMPHLEKVLLNGLRFRDVGRRKGGPFVANLGKVIQQRREAGSPLKELVVEKCLNMGNEDIAALKKFVKVVWDGSVDFEEVSRSDSDSDEDSWGRSEEEDDDDIYEGAENDPGIYWVGRNGQLIPA